MPLALAPVLLLLAAVETTTTEVRRVVGDPLPRGVVLGAGVALFALILIAGFVARRHR